MTSVLVSRRSWVIHTSVLGKINSVISVFVLPTSEMRGYWNQISHTQSMAAKRGLTNQANVHTLHVKKSFKTKYGRIPIDPAILAAIGHPFS